MRHCIPFLALALGFAPLAITAAQDAPAAAAAPGADLAKAELDTAIAAKQVTLLDCNGSKSYAKGHLPGALDFAVIKDDLAKHLPADKGALIVAYCGGPSCGAYKAGVDAAAKLGYTNIRHFSGGIKGWKEAGGKLEAAAH